MNHTVLGLDLREATMPEAIAAMVEAWLRAQEGEDVNRLPPLTPGELLKKEFLEPMKMSASELARRTGISPSTVSRILSGKQVITPDTDERLCRLFNLSDGYWLRAQDCHDIQL